ARHLERLIDADPELELVATGPLTAVCFRYAPEGMRGDETALDLLNLAILAGVNVRGRFALRSCALHYALDEGHVRAIADAVLDAGHRRVQSDAQWATGEITAPMPRCESMEEDATCAS